MREPGGAGAALVNTGLACMANRVWQPWYLTHGGPSPFWTLLAVLTGLLAAGPAMSLVARPLRRALGRT